MAEDRNIRHIDPKRHLSLDDEFPVADNVRHKFVVPLLEAIGWDLVEDLFFCEHGADVLVAPGGKEVLFVVQVVPWGEPLAGETRHLLCSGELAETGAGWAVLTSGSLTLVLDSLAVLEAVVGVREHAEPVAEYEFEELWPRFGEVSRLIGKIAGLGGFTELKRQTLEAVGLARWDEYQSRLDAVIEKYRELEEQGRL